MSNNHFLALAKTAYKNNDHFWKYNFSDTGETKEIIVAGIPFITQAQYVYSTILEQESVSQDDSVYIVCNQLNDSIREAYTHIHPRTFFITLPSRPAINMLQNVFAPSRRTNIISMESSISHDALYIATDASGGDDQSSSYWGWFTGSTKTPSYSAGLSTMHNTIHVEAEAVLRGVVDNSRTEADTIIIQSDGTTALKALSLSVQQNRIPGNLNTPVLVELVQEFKEVIQNKNVQLEYVPAHSNYAPNEQVDTLLSYLKINNLEACHQDEFNVHALALLMAGRFYDKTQEKEKSLLKKRIFTPTVIFSSSVNGELTTFMTQKQKNLVK